MMRRRSNLTPFLLGVAVALLAVVAVAQNTPSNRPVYIGRYQMLGNRTNVYVIDTSTGQLWARNERKVENYGTPDRPEYRSYQVPDR